MEGEDVEKEMKRNGERRIEGTKEFKKWTKRNRKRLYAGAREGGGEVSQKKQKTKKNNEMANILKIQENDASAFSVNLEPLYFLSPYKR